MPRSMSQEMSVLADVIKAFKKNGITDYHEIAWYSFKLTNPIKITNVKSAITMSDPGYTPPMRFKRARPSKSFAGSKASQVAEGHKEYTIGSIVVKDPEAARLLQGLKCTFELENQNG